MELDFEKRVCEIDEQIEELKKLHFAKGIDYSKEITELQGKKITELRKIYFKLTAWQIIQIARHPKRPVFQDYLENIVKDFRELHGDRCFGDDKAIITGFGKINRNPVMIIGQNKKGTINADKKIKELEEKYKLQFGNNKNSEKYQDLETKKKRIMEEEIRVKGGYVNPEGYRKALLKMKLAEKYQLPIVSFIDTKGAAADSGAEERGQASAIARNLMEMSQLKTPIIAIVIGEGGSGGALGIGVADRFAMLEYSYYSVIAPEACAAILFRNRKYAEEAAEALKLTSKDLYKLGLIDDIIQEPLGSAYRNPRDVLHNVGLYITKTLRELKKIKLENLLEKRYEKLRRVGSSYVIPS